MRRDPHGDLAAAAGEAILAWTWRPTDQKSHFWVKRFARIYPLHLATLIAAVVLASVTGGNNWVSVAASVPLLQTWGPESWRAGGNGPSWSLSVEMFFYLVFPFVIRPLMRTSGRQRLIIAAAVVIAMAVWNAGYFGLTRLDVPNAAIVSSYTNPLYRLGEFVLGIVIAAEFRAGWRPKVRLGYVVALGVAWYALLALANSVLAERVGLSTLPYGLLDLAFLPVSVGLIVSAASSDLFGAGAGLRGRVHVALGQWSFALYLIQMLVITVVVRVVGEEVTTSAGLLLLAWVVVSCIALSAAVFHLLERPAERMLRRALLPARDAVPKAPSPST